MATDYGIEGLTLLMTTDEVRGECDRCGWSTSMAAGAKDGRYDIDPGAPVSQIAIKIEKGVLVSMEATYSSPQPARAHGFGAALPIHKQVVVLGKKAWAAFSADRAVAILGDDAGGSVTAVHLGVLANEREVRAVIETYGSGLTPPERA